ncbi:hypothetical protein SOPP22_16870 [Shewanella sp. OPT22]|nr:hypothetical protein SOPP22_16870 [Shewanella sp. OPT22]
MSTNSENLNKGALIATSTYIGGFIVGYLFNILLARILAPDGYGNYKVAEAFVSLGSIIALMGGSKAAAKLLSEDIVGGNSRKVWTYVWFYLKVVIFASIAIFFLSILGHYLHISIFEGSSYHPILLASLTIPFSAASALIGCLFLISKRLVWSFAPWRIGFPLIRMILCGAVFIAAGSLSDMTAVFLMSLAALIIFSFQFRQALKKDLISLSGDSIARDQKVWLKTSIPLMFIIIIQILMSQVDIYMLEWMSGETSVGHFAAAQTTANLIMTIKNSVYAFIAPVVVIALKSDDVAMHTLSRKYFKLLISTALPLSLIIMFNADSILVWFGHDTELTEHALKFLTLGNMVDAIFGLSVIWLQYSDDQKLVIKILVTSLIINIILNILLIPIFDIEGAAIATGSVRAASTLIITLVVLKKYKLFPWGKKERQVLAE